MIRFRVEVNGPWNEWRPAVTAPIKSDVTHEEASTFADRSQAEDVERNLREMANPFVFSFRIVETS